MRGIGIDPCMSKRLTGGRIRNGSRMMSAIAEKLKNTEQRLKKINSFLIMSIGYFVYLLRRQ